jgi:hypothetical protein
LFLKRRFLLLGGAGWFLLQQALQASRAVALRCRCQVSPGQRRQQAAPAGLIGMLAGAAKKLLLADGALRHDAFPLRGLRGIA